MFANRIERRIGKPAWLLALLVASLATAGGCSLILDFGDSGGGGDEVDAMPAADAFFANFCSEFEPNNDIDNAVDAQLPAEDVEASICGGTGADFYNYTAPGGNQSVTISVQYVGRDLSVRVHDPTEPAQQTEVDSNDGSNGTASLQFVGSQLQNQLYIIEVFSQSGGEADYTLSVTDGT